MEEEPGCNELNNCHVNAACALDESSSRHVCICRPGFSGNGFHCEPSVIGCNVINSCHRDAQCLYDPDSKGYRCKCREVRTNFYTFYIIEFFTQDNYIGIYWEREHLSTIRILRR